MVDSASNVNPANCHPASTTNAFNLCDAFLDLSYANVCAYACSSDSYFSPASLPAYASYSPTAHAHVTTAPAIDTTHICTRFILATQSRISTNNILGA